MYFNRCYAGGTTNYAFNSISYGTISGLDSFPKYARQRNKPRVNTQGLFEILRDCDYKTIIAMLQDHPTSHTLYDPEPSLPGFEERYVGRLADSDEHPVFLRISEAQQNGQPFCLYALTFYDIIHSQFTILDFPNLPPSEMHRFILKKSNAVMECLLGGLERRGLLEDTMIIVYSDHGSSCFNRFVDTIPYDQFLPVAENSWVPLFIYNSGFGVGTSSDIVSLDDLRPTILSLLFPGKDFPRPDIPNYGVDLTRDKRTYAYSQNYYALGESPPTGGENLKSYAVTDGEYRLMVSACYPEKRIGGMSMYIDACDSGNCRDLLQLFEFDSTGHVIGLSTNIALDMVSRKEIPPMFRTRTLRELVRKYESLRENLRDYVSEKEKYALSIPGAQLAHAVPEESFRIPHVVLAENRMNRNGSSFSSKLKWLQKAKKPILLFGACRYGGKVVPVLQFYDIPLKAVLDNSIEKQTDEFSGMAVYSPREAAGIYPGAIVLGCALTGKTNFEMSRQCDQLGFEYHNILMEAFQMRLRI